MRTRLVVAILIAFLGVRPMSLTVTPVGAQAGGQGSLLAWGDNVFGQIGDGTSVDRVNPVGVSGLPASKAIATGAAHSLALASDGTVWAWGYNPAGQLGDGTKTSRRTPALVPGLSGIIAIAAGTFHSLALDADGTIWAWGGNAYGQVGDGTGGASDCSCRTSPVHLSGPDAPSGIIAIATWASHNLALASNGTVWAWGQNYAGQVGDGTTTTRYSPVHLPPLGGGLVAPAARLIAVAAGDDYSLALATDGTIWAWGGNSWGQLGEGTTASHGTPLHLAQPTGVKAIAAGHNHSLALDADGTIWAWGGNTYGQVGDGTTTNRLLPVHLAAPLNGTAIAAGSEYSLVLVADGTIWVWGWNSSGRLGDGTTTTRLTPVHLTGAGAPSRIMALAAGGGHSLALRALATSASWGFNNHGQLGDGTTIDRHSPVPVPGPIGLVALAGEDESSLALSADGTLWAWGRNSEGQLGDGTTTERLLPIHLAAPVNIIAIAAYLHTLALAADGTVWTWGLNAQGQLGLGQVGTPDYVSTPHQVPGLTGVVAIKAGPDESLALTANGQLWTWGNNHYGELGDGTTLDHASPTVVPGLGAIKAIAADGHKTLAIAGDGTLWAWGNNNSGQLGDGTLISRSSPEHLAAPTGVKALAAGFIHSLALAADGTLWSWGENNGNQLGFEEPASGFGSHLTPVHVTYPTDIIAVEAGHRNSLLLTSDATVFACGTNLHGELGDGTTNYHSSPVHLVTPTLVTGIAMHDSNSLVLGRGPQAKVVPPLPGLGSVTVTDLGDQITLTAVPAPDKLFLGWQVSGSQVVHRLTTVPVDTWANPLTITLTEDTTITPVFGQAPVFGDVAAGDPAATAIAQLAARGIINGCFPTETPPRYCPTDSTLRHQMAALIVRAMPGWTDETWANPFSDPTEDAELMRRVATLGHYQVANGYQAEVCIAQGKTPPCYGPLDSVKYGQAILFISRAMVAKGYWSLQPDDRTVFPDQNGATRADPNTDRQTLDHRALVTYVHLAGAPPDVPDPHATFAVGGTGSGIWGAAAPRAWFARALWQALDSYFAH